MAKRSTKPSSAHQPPVEVKLEKFRISNAPPEEFRKQVMMLAQLGYEVDDLSDGRKIVVTKPGGKSVNDIMVWVYEGPGRKHWRPSHSKIHRDLRIKVNHDRKKALAVIEALEKVYNGVEPDNVLLDHPNLGAELPGLPVDLILKAYKWIWVQEDINYPPPLQGRGMSMAGIQKIKQEAIKLPDQQKLI